MDAKGTQESRAVMVLRRMNKAEYGVWRAEAIAGYAADKVASGQWSAEESVELARKEHECRGHAYQALRVLETHVQGMGLHGLALHVFGHNHAARALYAKHAKALPPRAVKAWHRAIRRTGRRASAST